MISTLGEIFSRRHIKIFFLLFQENNIWHFTLIVSNGDNLHEMSNPVFFCFFFFVFFFCFFIYLFFFFVCLFFFFFFFFFLRGGGITKKSPICRPQTLPRESVKFRSGLGRYYSSLMKLSRFVCFFIVCFFVVVVFFFCFWNMIKVFLHTTHFWKGVCSKGSKFLSFQSTLLFRRGGKTLLTGELLIIQVHSFPLRSQNTHALIYAT